jgi:hypothetical protein
LSVERCALIGALSAINAPPKKRAKRKPRNAGRKENLKGKIIKNGSKHPLYLPIANNTSLKSESIYVIYPNAIMPPIHPVN